MDGTADPSMDKRAAVMNWPGAEAFDACGSLLTLQWLDGVCLNSLLFILMAVGAAGIQTWNPQLLDIHWIGLSACLCFRVVVAPPGLSMMMARSRACLSCVSGLLLQSATWPSSSWSAYGQQEWLLSSP